MMLVNVEESSLLLAEKLQSMNLQLVTAESCTGGLVAATMTEIPGSSAWFERGFVTYSNQAKITMLGVSAATLKQHGAVSEAIAIEMAEGALTNSLADVAIAITGVAGPTGGSDDKPVGTVCFAWALPEQVTSTITQCFIGTRHSVRQQATRYCFQELLACL